MMNVLEMIEDMQERAKAARGKLDDLALPEDLYEDLIIQLGSKAFFDPVTGKLTVNGTTVHTGDSD